jgi:serine protease Do
MNIHSFASPRRLVLSAAGLIAAAGLTWAAVLGTGSAGGTIPEIRLDRNPIAAGDSALGRSYAPIVRRVAPSVVKVKVIERAQAMQMTGGIPYGVPPELWDFFGGSPFGGGQVPQQQVPQQQGVGSGVIASPDGFILTNNHVVAGADTIRIGLSDGREFTARVVGWDEATDLAVVKIDATDLPAVVFADSDTVEVGDRVLALGNPFDVGMTVTSGMVSGLGRRTPGGGIYYEDFIQTDAAINPGNSGGALVDAEGRLIGINTAIVSRSGGFQGIGFAIPANLAVNVMNQLVENGTVVRGYLGVRSQAVDSLLAEQFNLPSVSGAIIVNVEPGTPADRGGLLSGDVITRFNGREVADERALGLIVAQVAPGSTVSAEVYRDGERRTMDFTVNERTETASSGRMGGGRGFQNPGNRPTDDGTLDGVAVTDLNNRTRQEFGIPNNVRGALVVEVDPTSEAAQAGLMPGDVILEINRQPVGDARAAINLSAEATSDRTLVKVWGRQGGQQGFERFIVVDESGN